MSGQAKIDKIKQIQDIIQKQLITVSSLSTLVKQVDNDSLQDDLLITTSNLVINFNSILTSELFGLIDGQKISSQTVLNASNFLNHTLNLDELDEDFNINEEESEDEENE